VSFEGGILNKPGLLKSTNLTFYVIVFLQLQAINSLLNPSQIAVLKNGSQILNPLQVKPNPFYSHSKLLNYFFTIFNSFTLWLVGK
jgi:hypothetical protein